MEMENQPFVDDFPICNGDVQCPCLPDGKSAVFVGETVNFSGAGGRFGVFSAGR